MAVASHYLLFDPSLWAFGRPKMGFRMLTCGFWGLCPSLPEGGGPRGQSWMSLSCIFFCALRFLPVYKDTTRWESSFFSSLRPSIIYFRGLVPRRPGRESAVGFRRNEVPDSMEMRFSFFWVLKKFSLWMDGMEIFGTFSKLDSYRWFRLDR